MSQPPGPPYAPRIAGVGGHATPIPDAPICSVLLVFYVGSAIGHMSLLKLNNRKNHRFLISYLLFGFSMTRILTLSLRIGTAYHPSNISLAIAATIFANVGILIVYVVNLLFVQRIIRARQPEIGWQRVFRISYKIVWVLTAVALILVIVFIIISDYTLDPHLGQICRDIQLAAITWFLIIAASPLLLLAISYALPLSKNSQTFGNGSEGAKALIVATSSGLCTLGAGFKAGVNWQAPRPVLDPAWYHSKACFYVFFFVLEIVILYFFLAVRIDKRFHVPNGSSKRGHFGVSEYEEGSQKEGGSSVNSRESDEEKAGNA